MFSNISQTQHTIKKKVLLKYAIFWDLGISMGGGDDTIFFFHFKNSTLFPLNYKPVEEKLKHCFTNSHLLLALSIAYHFFLK